MFRHFLATLLRRVNTLTGLAYRCAGLACLQLLAPYPPACGMSWAGLQQQQPLALLRLLLQPSAAPRPARA